MTRKQAEKLKVKSWSQLSSQLEKCCLLLSANESYQRTSEDLQVLTGIKVSASSQQRLVQRYSFPVWMGSNPVEAMSIDGGKVRLRTPKGEKSVWNDYKAIQIHGQGVCAHFKDNDALIDWANSQLLGELFGGLGDGHAGIWNIFAKIGCRTQRREILDWYHLVENLYKIPGSENRLQRVKTLLWTGQVDASIEQLVDCNSSEAHNFIQYLQTHRSRLLNYEALQQQGFDIGSGAVESAIKQIGARIKISGAQWAEKNVPQALKHRCAYLNGYFTAHIRHAA
jgi:hypothetical protein